MLIVKCIACVFLIFFILSTFVVLFKDKNSVKEILVDVVIVLLEVLCIIAIIL